MKKLTKLLGIVLIMALVMSMGTAAFAADEETPTVNITVNRDSTYGAGAEGDREFTWYRVFTATMNGTHTATGGGYNSDGTAGTINDSTGTGAATAFAYTASSAVAAKLGSWDATTSTWNRTEPDEDDETDTGNIWFDLTPIAGTTNYSVKWINSNTDAATAQAAAKWLFDHQVWEATGSLTGNGTAASGDNPATPSTKWTATVPAGYYLIGSSEGQNLVAATTDITINEKNSYPTVDKKQGDTAGTYSNDALGVKVGDTVYYQVEVKVPADATEDIVVKDTLSTGLELNIPKDDEGEVTGSALTITPTLTADVAATATDDGKRDYVIGSETATGWTATIHPTAATKGKTVTFTFAATVTSDALVSTDRKNDVEIDYGNYHQEDTVEFDIGAAAIIKYDGATADLDEEANTLSAKTGKTIAYLEATFALTDSKGNAVNVSEATSGTKGVYVVDAASKSNSVTSDKQHNGIILIYGLDPDETYTLTETATEAGYNLLSGTVSLTPTKAEKTSVNTIKVTVAEASGITAGNASADADHTLELAAKQVNKVENNSGTVLPSTGGIGTTIFYVVGSILVVAAGVLLITKKRMSREG
ncbi:MAG: isopeptide-forming domain-containing fimbrial protein [Oscillospiraceae bacterium]|nr:isopeptide-forming domain-containing fimbrial protein [Oscillospiraceae bacterium]